MARVSSFEEITAPRNQVHRTEVRCGYTTIESEGKRYLQLETYGSDERQIPGKVSQTLQIDAGAAAELLRLIGKTFPEIKQAR